MKLNKIVYSPIIPVVFTVILLVIGFRYGISTPQRSNNKTPEQERIYQKCPDDYATDDAGSAEYIAATNKWTNDFYDAHTGASLSDWSVARYQFWVENNCFAALERYKIAKEGKADSATMQRILDSFPDKN